MKYRARHPAGSHVLNSRKHVEQKRNEFSLKRNNELPAGPDMVGELIEMSPRVPMGIQCNAHFVFFNILWFELVR